MPAPPTTPRPASRLSSSGRRPTVTRSTLIKAALAITTVVMVGLLKYGPAPALAQRGPIRPAAKAKTNQAEIGFYKVVPTNPFTPEEYEAELNKLHEQGWVLHSVVAARAGAWSIFYRR